MARKNEGKDSTKGPVHLHQTSAKHPRAPTKKTIARQLKLKGLSRFQVNVRQGSDLYRILRSQLPQSDSTKVGNHVINRHLQTTCHDLDTFDRRVGHNRTRPKLQNGDGFRCYGCNKIRRSPHAVYVFSCYYCGELFQKHRHLSRALDNNVTAVITGTRTQLGHQVVLKLLRAGARVIGTTPQPDSAKRLFESYEDSRTWIDRLCLLQIDLDSPSIVKALEPLHQKLLELQCHSVDILINCAAQTIRAREKPRRQAPPATEKNRYGDDRFVDCSQMNSWSLRIEDICQAEMEEVLRVNTIAPTLLIQQLLPWMLKSKQEKVHIVNVHAREGRFSCCKDDRHLHTNLAKAGLAMLTKSLSGRWEWQPSDCTDSLQEKAASVHKNKTPRVCIHGCDPGWISVDEYYEDDSPWVAPPLDEVDGAARILYPVWKQYAGSSKTSIHFDKLAY